MAINLICQTRNKKATTELLNKAEALKALIAKVEMGNNLESKEVAMAGAIQPNLILGYSEEERLKSKQQF